VADLTRRSALSHVKVVSPRAHDLVTLLEARGATVANGTPHELIVTGLDAGTIGAVAFEHGIPLKELSTQRASLEAAFMELTRDSVEFRAGSDSATTATVVTEIARELSGKAE
jgi:ABC-2 type transport system ATP-binding protein